MIDFFLAALPFIIIGISVAVIVVNSNNNKESYICEGMFLGMSIALLLGTSFASEHLGIFLSLGMLVGEAVGSSIRKNK